MSGFRNAILIWGKKKKKGGKHEFNFPLLGHTKHRLPRRKVKGIILTWIAQG